MNVATYLSRIGMNAAVKRQGVELLRELQEKLENGLLSINLRPFPEH
ncbi:hypothetical protein [Ectobacillus panaciterrae]|nr:hypothetical protein [Ectobacillus panaciterrae]